MRAGRDLNVRIATEILGFEVKLYNGEFYEFRPQGNRPLRNYSTEMECAWEVAAAMKVTLIPIVGDQWFAFIGSPQNAGWESPQAVLEFLNAGQFAEAGAAVNINPALAICSAALKMIDKKTRLGAEVNDQARGLHSKNVGSESIDLADMPVNADPQ